MASKKFGTKATPNLKTAQRPVRSGQWGPGAKHRPILPKK